MKKIVDAMWRKVHKEKGQVVIALDDYTPEVTSKGQIPFRKGDRFILIKSADSNKSWWKLRREDDSNKTLLAPSNRLVKELISVDLSKDDVEKALSKDDLEVVIAIDDYTPEVTSKGQIPFLKGDRFLLMKSADANKSWWKLRREDDSNRTLLAPSNMVVKERDLADYQLISFDLTKEEVEQALSKGDLELGSFIIRARDSNFNNPSLSLSLVVKVKPSSDSNSSIARYLILRENNSYQIDGARLTFQTLMNLVHHYADRRNRSSPQLTYSHRLHEYMTLWDYRDEAIEKGRLIGAGSFGEVFEGKLFNEEVVALKYPNARTDVVEFLNEAQIGRLCKHPNILETIGVCSKRHLIITQFMAHGNLKKYFGKRKMDKMSELSPKQCNSIAYKIACGMEYLARNTIIHRYLAAVNVLVGDTIDTIKICDFAFSRRLLDSEYYLTCNALFPLKWTAPEAMVICYDKSIVPIQNGIVTFAADVWSYGVVLWELFTNGAEPYTEIEAGDLYTELKENNYRLPKPAKCSPDIYSKMLECWNIERTLRPDFTNLREFFACHIIEKESDEESGNEEFGTTQDDVYKKRTGTWREDESSPTDNVAENSIERRYPSRSILSERIYDGSDLRLEIEKLRLEIKDLINTKFKASETSIDIGLHAQTHGSHHQSSRSKFCEDFTVNGILGTVGKNTVFSVKSQLDACDYAVKRITLNAREETIEKVLREVRAISQIDHSGIIRCHSTWIERDRCENQEGCSGSQELSNCAFIYVQMQLGESSLEAWLAQNRSPWSRSVPKMAMWFNQVVTAVNYLHGKSLVHRNLKPSNILFVDRDRLKLSDMGIVNMDDGSNMLNESKYISPEQQAMIPYSWEADVFSLGLIFAEMCVIMNADEAKTVFDNYRCGKYNTSLDLLHLQSVKKFVAWLTNTNSSERPKCRAIHEHIEHMWINEAHENVVSQGSAYAKSSSWASQAFPNYRQLHQHSVDNPYSTNSGVKYAVPDEYIYPSTSSSANQLEDDDGRPDIFDLDGLTVRRGPHYGDERERDALVAPSFESMSVSPKSPASKK